MIMIPLFNEQTQVGSIKRADDGPQIRYTNAWRASTKAFPISLSMPLSAEDWDTNVSVPWLMNLLPEGEPLRAMTQALGVAREDILGLILETGRDLAGALTIGQQPPQNHPDLILISTPDALERIINEMPAKPFLVGEDGVSMSLAGAQEKLPLTMRDGNLAIPINGAASTHILKPDNPRLPGSVQNEALCMVLARRCGLPTADVITGIAGERSYLLVTRYDRFDDNGRTRRLHQEDFCQALGRPPAAKYEHDGTGQRGPSLADMFNLVRAHMTALDLTRFLDAAIFNIAVGNVDSHAKNYSILLKPTRSELAPLYDLMSGLTWLNITQNHAQDVGGQRRGRHIYARHWRRLAESAGLSGTATVRRVSRVTERILRELPAAINEVAAMPAGSTLLDVFADAIAERTRLIRENALRPDGDDTVGETAANLQDEMRINGSYG
ncbi:Serine/threonine-protein kinase toxin HipA (plasmid) [Asticcacaulis sp. MM231]|uniref:type II toxin-antitoxin system HipA family toxin n=1 Tax=Asticcacaulis sp. MM231 TaxID=3157666 RepID=UPI0032D57A95